VKISLSLAFVFALAAVPAAAQVAQTQTPPVPVIVTTGEGVVKQAPDRAWVTIATETRGATADEVQRLNSAAMTAVIDRIRGTGIAADAIQTTGFNLQPQFEYTNGRQIPRGYLAVNQVQVRVDTIAKTGDVIGAAVGTGANKVENVRFDLKDRETATRAALRLAVREARAKADALASGAGVSIDRIVMIEEEGTEQPRPLMQPRIASMAETVQVGGPPIETGEIEVRARVTLTAAIR
jgi:uncharacterized protein